MDGVNGVTQCPIVPHEYFVYEFEVTKYGSSWYRSHYSVQYADGAAGPKYDEAISPPLIMTDWYHNSAFISVANGDFGGPSVLLNGIGDVRKWSGANNSHVPMPFSIRFDKPQPGSLSSDIFFDSSIPHSTRQLFSVLTTISFRLSARTLSQSFPMRTRRF